VQVLGNGRVREVWRRGGRERERRRERGRERKREKERERERMDEGSSNTIEIGIVMKRKRGKEQIE
jgi:hypothetical protein